MSYQEVLKLFDFYWFKNEIFRNKTKPSSSSSSSSSNPVLDMNKEFDDLQPPLMKLSHTPSFIVRSFSDQALSSLSNSDSPSPKSVIPMPKLETILSGKEVREFSEPAAKIINIEEAGFDEKINRKSSDDHQGGKKIMKRRKGKRMKGSRSLSELEFEELKGFMDLGFVFSDEDKDSSLVSIIPGLQRFGKKVAGEEENHYKEKEQYDDDESTVSRPYLSEAWDDLDEMKAQKKKLKNPLMDWRIPAAAMVTDVEIKDQLKFWAHAVASTVR